jgi:hypothetical protein
MSIEEIVAVLTQERDKLSAAIEALQRTPRKGPAIETTPKKRKRFSAATRRKMSIAQKKRQAALRAGK